MAPGGPAAYPKVRQVVFTFAPTAYQTELVLDTPLAAVSR